MLTRYWGKRPAKARAFVASTARAGIVTAFVGVTIGVTIGCGSDATEATAPANANVASIELPTLSTALLAGDTLHLAAVARDAKGRVLSGVNFIWSSSDSALVEVESEGRLTSRGHGSVLVSATAGGVRATTTVQTRLTAEERRFAYAWVHDPSESATYLPSSSYQHNETGGRVLVAHRATGDYTVTFERMAKVDSAFRETVLVTPYGAAGERCHLTGWDNAANGRDLDVAVSCYTFSGARTDARFSVLVVGSHSLPSRMAFTASGDAASAYAAAATHSFTSFGDRIAINRSTAGSYLVQMNGAPNDTPENYLVSTVGGASDLCKVSSWNHGVWASVICYAPNGMLTDSRFALLMVASGRLGKRFGFAWADAPSSPLGESYAPNLRYQRTSSGATVRITHVATGVFRVSFPGLARVGNRSETVQVSPYGGGLYTCQVEGWTNSADGASLDATVRCWNRGNGRAADTYFTILVLE